MTLATKQHFNVHGREVSYQVVVQNEDEAIGRTVLDKRNLSTSDNPNKPRSPMGITATFSRFY